MNNSGMLSSNLVQLAYRLLKQDTYYNKMDLFLRTGVAAYEAIGSFQKWQDTLATIIAVARKIFEKTLQEGSKHLMEYD